jgi:preprotein translocase subunit SecF
MIDFVKKSKITATFSILLIVIGVLLSAFYGFKVSIEYTGGTNISLNLESTSSESVEALKEEIKEYFNSKESVIKRLDVLDKKIVATLIYLQTEEVFSIKSEIQEKFPDVVIENIETIDPSYGLSFMRNSFVAVFLSLVAMVFYITYSFRKITGPTNPWNYGVSAVVALIHDLLFVIATFSILGHFFGVEIDGLFLTALLTVVGFSVNDTIVVFDRIRENYLKYGDKNSFEYICNLSIFETLNRSIITSFTVVFVMFSLFLLGGDSIRYFSLAVVVGVISGTYSSVFIATPLVIWLGRKFRK